MVRSLFLQLMRKDLIQFTRIYWGKFFDTAFLFFTNVIVFGYFMPSLGLSDSYGPFILIGAIASFGLFDVVGSAGELMFDIEGDKKISYTLSMPIPSYVVFGQLAMKWALNVSLLCLPLFVVGKLLLWKQFDLSKINYFQLSLMYPSICIFFGVFSLWLAGVLHGIKNIGRLYVRVINPIFMFGGYFFTWEVAALLSPVIGYLLLLNPMIYVMEGIRSAVLGSEGYLPFYGCLFALWGFILLLYFHAISRLKARLDCI